MDSVALITELQEFLMPFADYLRWLSLHTYAKFYLIITAALYWSGYAVIGARLTCGILMSTIVFGCCRHFFISPRPYWEYQNLFQGVTERAHGMPSGHSQNAIVFWGLSAWSIRKISFWLIALMISMTIAVSRLFLAVHYPVQVLAGLGLGILFLFLWSILETRILHWLKQKTLRKQLFIIFLISSLPLVITLSIQHLFELVINNENSFPYQKLFFYTGLLSGAAVGCKMAFLSGKMTQCPTTFKLIVTRTLPGLILVILMWKLRLTSPEFIESPAVLYSLLWFQGCMIAFWSSYLWPLIHQKLCTVTDRTVT